MNYGFFTDRPLLLTHPVFSFVQQASKRVFVFPAMISSFLIAFFPFDFLTACLLSSWAGKERMGDPDGTA
jgi:hypothetical protein